MKFGLALGGGGARGAAHIGVMQELERRQIKPDLVTGTSIGGMLGALYAAGIPTETILEFFQQLTPTKMYVLPGAAPSLTGTTKIESLLEDLLGRPTFSDLAIPFSVVTTNLVTKKEVILDQGDLIQAILATIAVPILFPPVEIDGMPLVDGGLLNNTPFAIARARGANFVLAVDLSNTDPYGAPEPVAPAAPTLVERALAFTQRRRTWQVMSAVMDIVTAKSLQTHLAISQPEILLQPYLGSIGFLDFHRWEEGVAAGEEALHGVETELHEGISFSSTTLPGGSS
jgi:NTE family protein